MRSAPARAPAPPAGPGAPAPPAGPAAPAPPAAAVTGCLTVQVAAREPLEALRLGDRPGGGVVFTAAGAIEAGHAAHRQGFSPPTLTDPRRYPGAPPAPGTA